MDPWKESAAWEDYRDLIRDPAQLAGKRELPADRLVPTNAVPAATPLVKAIAITAGIRLAAWIVEAWYYLTRR
jgi:hypothetical protein